MINSILGAGIIGLPFAVAQAGFILGTVLLFVMAILTDFSLRLLVESGLIIGVTSYQVGYSVVLHMLLPRIFLFWSFARATDLSSMTCSICLCYSSLCLSSAFCAMLHRFCCFDVHNFCVTCPRRLLPRPPWSDSSADLDSTISQLANSFTLFSVCRQSLLLL